MPANQRPQTAQSPTSPTFKATAKYTNKDGSKYIKVPKSQITTDSSETSPTMAQTTTQANGQIPNPTPGTNGAPPVNRKKQKRRQKLAAKLQSGQPAGSQANGAPSSDHDQRLQEVEARLRQTDLGADLDEAFDDNGQFDPADGEQYYSEEDGDRYSGSYGHNGSLNGYAAPASGTGKKSKKKKKAKGIPPQSLEHVHSHAGTNGLSHNHVSLPPLASTNMPRGPGISKEKIWNTSSAEERERIKEFWLSLGEDERKSLVKVEKDAVLKKMKEQQKHSCSCTVCGRKRTAIEEELEVLYDAYYEELEQYANGQGDGRPVPMMAPPRRFGALSGLQPPNRLPPAFNGQPSRGRIVEDLGDDEEEEGDEEYSEEEGDEDEYSDDEPEELPRPIASDFFNFGNSLTVQGGILTVADDLLKNDGKKFIEMMEQLAERRMAREEDAREQFSNPNYGHPPNGSMHTHSHNHNHPPQPDDEEYDDDEDDEEEYDSQEEDYDEEEMDSMTEEQRMEEGRRMFQIFAARMFEQRVLQAYREKVAKERQQKLLEELEEETRADSQKKAKKAKDAQKKKEKLAEKKKALKEAQEKQDAEKAAKEAQLRAAEEKKLEEARLKAEEKRKKKEAQKKAEEEERLRKEAEKQRARERVAEAERKAKEAKEKERKEKEELKKKEKESREAKERERKEKLEKEKREKEAKLKAEKEAREKQKRDELAAQQAAAQAAIAATQASKRPQVPIPANLQPHAIASPHIPVATPAIPKAPTPIKLRTTSSQQDSNSSVPQTPQTGGVSQNVSPVPTTPLQGSPGPIGPPGKQAQQNPFLHQPQATSPMHAALKSPPGIPPQPSPFGMQPMGMGFQPGFPMPPGFGGMYPGPGPFDPRLGGPNGMPMHPGLMHQIPQGRGFPPPHGPPGFPQRIPNGLGGVGQPFAPKEGPMSQPHSRQQSGSFDKPFEAPGNAQQAQPIARPAPIGRPASVVHGQRRGNDGNTDVDDLSNHLGSSALLDDSDEPLTSGAGVRRPSVAPGLNSRPNFPPPFGMEPFTSPIGGFPTWGAPPNPFGTSSLPGSNYMGGWGPPAGSSFGSVGGSQPIRPSQPRSVVIRLLICQACKNLEGSNPDGYYDINTIKDQVDQGNQFEQAVSEQELLDICETEGSALNGGGSFDIRKENNGHYSIRYEDDLPVSHRPVGAPGSPIVGSGGISRFTGPPPGF
ncbi:hypothetical protein L207DRAFT_448201 [Hyaloscypha variabilis F]|uniref:Stress response protein NST1 n=1 Tax=Hyaloscypha variabilis (strain UAMH 11265 / GT02V1 / F) TaxID=1149755 RepID=A0A2J6SDT9_HYAVF|nr:hypothetical protein L207DRAFT_448201 [Hyaloscypha variabilis F]